MSDISAEREWRFYLDDMIGFCQRVQTFTAGMAQDQFTKDAMRFDATVRNIELMLENLLDLRHKVSPRSA